MSLYLPGGFMRGGFIPGRPPPLPTDGRCQHLGVEDVTLSLTGEVVAAICVGCYDQLPAGWRSPFGHIDRMNKMVRQAFANAPQPIDL